MRRARVAQLFLHLPCLAGYAWQGFVHHVWGWSLIGLAISVGFACSLLHSAESGEAITVRGSFSRHSHPVIFWLITTFSLLGYGALVTAMFAAGPFSIRANEVLDVPAADWNKSGGVSDKLLLSLSYAPSGSKFKITLRNVSPHTLSLMVDPHIFHGDIVVPSSGGPPIEYMESSSRELRLTSNWMDPIQSLRPKAEITWQIPVSQLRDVHNRSLDPRSLRGTTVHATLDKIAVVPAHGGFISSNAKQISKPVTIPANR